jgi:hypothetical protein
MRTPLTFLIGLALGACSSQTIVVQQAASTTPTAAPDASVPPTPSLCGGADGGPVFGPPSGYPTGTGPWQIAVADVNGDGKLDLVVANGGVAVSGPPDPPGSSLTILYGHGDGTFPASESVSTQPGTVGVIAADFSNTGKPDLAVASCDEADGGAGGAVQLFSIQSNGLFVGSAPYQLAGCPNALASGDFNGDGRLDLAAASPGYFGGADGVIVLFNHGDHVIGPPILYPTAAAQNDLAVADLNGDGLPDLVSIGADSSVTVFLNDGPGPGDFQQLAPVLLPGGPYNSIALADFDADGKQDAALVDTNNGTLALLFGRGDGSFDAPIVVGTPGYPWSVVAADFNGDGLPDILVAYEGGPFNGVDIYLNQGGGSFVGPTEFLTDCCSFNAAVGDFNGDGLPDLAIANNTESFATILLDECDAVTPPDAGTAFTEAQHTALPQVPYNGGPVLPAPQLVTIHYTGDPGQAHNEAYDAWIAGSQWLATVGVSYGVSPGVDLADVVLPEAAPTAITDAEIQQLLVDEIDAGVLPPPANLDGDGGMSSVLYMFYFPSQTVISSPGLGTSCQSYGGYHSEDGLGAVTFPYAVLPFCYGDQGYQDVAASHELIEASTDPFPFTAPGYVFNDDSSPWAYVPGEVADLCVDYDLQIDGRDVQRIWSNDAAMAGTQPCVPAPAGPYFNATPVQPNTFEMNAGETTTLQLTGWSTGPMPGPFGIAFEPIYYAQVFGPGFFVPEVSLDRLTLQNGQTANLTITIPEGTPAQSFAPFAIDTGRYEGDPNSGYYTFLITVP